MIEITDEMVTTAAMSDAEFDGRPWASLGRGDRERYMARARASVGVVAPIIAATEREACIGVIMAEHGRQLDIRDEKHVGRESAQESHRMASLLRGVAGRVRNRAQS